jgi:hypothetical protein
LFVEANSSRKKQQKNNNKTNKQKQQPTTKTGFARQVFAVPESARAIFGAPQGIAQSAAPR